MIYYSVVCECVQALVILQRLGIGSCQAIGNGPNLNAFVQFSWSYQEPDTSIFLLAHVQWVPFPTGQTQLLCCLCHCLLLAVKQPLP